MNKIDKNEINKEKNEFIEPKHELKIKNKDLNKINFLNLQHYFDIIKKLQKENINISTDFIDNFISMNNTFKKQKFSPFSRKIRNDIKQISHHIYDKNSTNNNKDNNDINKRFIDQYKYIINSSSSVSPSLNQKNTYLSYEKNLKNHKIPIKVYYFQDKDKNNANKLSKNVNRDRIRNNTVDSISHYNDNKKRIKFEYENYALNNINYNHPQIYILNSNFNSTTHLKERLPLIEAPNGFKYRRSGDLSYLIPYNTKKRKVRDNFYSYYIGMKLSKQNF